MRTLIAIPAIASLALFAANPASALTPAWKAPQDAAVGLAAGAAVGAAARYDIGATLASLPAGTCSEQIVGAASYYQCGPTWLRAYYGNNGLYYRVVAAP